MGLQHLLQRIAPAVVAAAGLFAAGCASTAGPSQKLVAHSPCSSPPRYSCPDGKECNQPIRTFLGEAYEPKTQRTFFLDYPCDLKPGEKIAFVLNLHGGGSIGNWQRSYFPAVDQKENLRLVVATPTALTAEPSRRWVGEADDAYLQNITDLVIAEFGKANIKTFWLAGHSQGGATSRRIVCSDYFKDKVDGFLSLSGGRVGTPASVSAGIRPLVAPPTGSPPPPPAAPAALPTCDFSFIFAIGEREPSSATANKASEWAQKYGCGSAAVRKPDIIDAKAGYVTASDQSRGPSWGTYARPGTAQVYQFEGCRDGRVVADVVRMEKGHTEGLEPVVTRSVLEMMLSAKGGKISGG